VKPPKVPEFHGGGAAASTNLGTTWPLFRIENDPPFPEDPKLNVTPFRPDTRELEALENDVDLPESTEQSEDEQRRLRETYPPTGADWARAAQTMIAWLSERVQKGSALPIEQAMIARAWVAFSLGGTTVPQVLKVAHLVSRAHTAIRETPRGDRELQAAVVDCARVLHAGLPRVIKARMPLERAIQVVRALRGEPDAWPAVVEGTSELLGWTDYARAHAAATIRTVIELGRP
jgi:hypothetical protein